jgi:hypothetical protein
MLQCKIESSSDTLFISAGEIPPFFYDNINYVKGENSLSKEYNYSIKKFEIGKRYVFRKALTDQKWHVKSDWANEVDGKEVTIDGPYHGLIPNRFGGYYIIAARWCEEIKEKE